MKTSARKSARNRFFNAHSLLNAAEAFSRGEVSRLGRSWARLMAGALIAAACVPVYAGPEGEQIVRGNVSFTRDGATTLIRASDRAIINYRSFDIANGETVRFIQPSASARVLNRITSAAPTRIDGNLFANGQVYFVNPAGVYFGRDAVVDVAGLVVAAGRMSDMDFVRGVDRFTGLSGTVSNQGLLKSPFVTLLGASAVNTGNIIAPKGTVIMGSAEEAIIGKRDGGVMVRLTGSAATPTPGAAAVENSGTINADRGQVVIAAGDVYSLAIRQSGSVRAKDIKVQGQGTGVVSVEGKLDATNQGAGGRGGKIEVTGQRVGIIGGEVDASGRTGGGEINIGGGLQGKGDIRRADITAVDETAVIKADATQSGSGGRVVVWSDQTTQFYGNISVTGAGNGKGGFVETSSKGGGVFNPNSIITGRGGSWLIDPRNINIKQVAASSGMNTGDLANITPTADNAELDVDVVNNALSAGTSVTVTTSDAAGAQAGNIVVEDNIVKSAGGAATLTLRAANDIDFSTADITNSSGSALNVNLIANDSAQAAEDGDTAAGNVSFAGDSFDLGSGSLTISGVNITTGTVTSAGAIALTATNNITTGVVTTSSSINLNAANNITVDGDATTTGSFSATSTGGAGTVTVNNNHTINSVGATLSATTAVVVNGDVNAGSGNVTIEANELNFDANSSVAGTGTLDIRTKTAATNIVIGDNADNAGALDLLDNELDSIGTNFSAVTIGASTMSGGITIAGDSTFGDNLTLNSGTGTIDFGAVLTMGANSLSLVANEINLPAANIVGTGAFTVRSNGADIKIGAAADDAAALDLLATELAFLPGTFSSITFGDSAMTAGITISGAATFTEGVTFDTDTGTINVANALSASSLTFSGPTTLAANVSSSGGAITLNNAVTLAADTVVNSGAGSIILNSTLSGSVNDVTLIGGLVDINGAMSSTSGDMTFTGPTELGANISSDTGDVSFGSSVALTSNLTIGANDVAFGTTLNGAHTLAVNTSGNGVTTFNGVVGGTAPLTGLTTNGDGTVVVNSAVNTDGLLSFGDVQVDLGANLNSGTGDMILSQDVVLLADVTLSGANITFSDSVDSDGTPRALTLNSGGLTSLASVGVNAVLASITTDAAGTTSIGGNVSATGAVAINDATTLTNNTTISGGTITFGNTIDGAFGLTLNSTGATTLSGNVGTGTALTSVTTNAGGTTNIGGNITASGAVAINDATTLTNNTTVSGGTITFGDTVDGGFGLTLNSTGATTLSGNVGTGTALTSVTTDAGGTTNIGGNITASGAVAINDAATLTNNTTVSGGTITFGDTVDGGFGLTLNSSGATTLSGNVGTGTALTSVTTNAGGTTSIGGNITASGAVAINDAATLTNNVTVNAGSITFGNTVNGAFALALDSAGTTTLSGAIGNTTALASLTTDAGGTTNLSTNINANGTVRFNDAVDIAAGMDIAADKIEFASALDLNDATVTLAANEVDFLGGAGSVTANALQATLFFRGSTSAGNIAVGGAEGTGALDVSADDLAAMVDNIGSLNFGDASMTGTITLENNVSFKDAASFITSATGSIAAGNVTGTDEASLTFSGPTTIANVQTDSGIIQFNNLLTLNGNVTLNAPGASTEIIFNGPVTLGAASTINSGSGEIRLNDTFSIGANNVTLTGGLVDVNGAMSATSGLMTFNGPTELGASISSDTGDVTFQSSVSLTSNVIIGANDVTFNGTLNGARDLEVNTSGNGVTTFNAIVGGTAALTRLTTNADGTVDVNAAINTNGLLTLADTQVDLGANLSSGTGDIILSNDVVLTDDVTLAGANITFSDSVDSDATARNLTLNSSGATTLTSVGVNAALSSLTTDAAGTTVLQGSSINVVGAMTLNDAATLESNVTVNAGTITFGGTVDSDDVSSPRALTLNSSGVTTLSGAVGNTAALASLATDAGGSTVFGSSVNAGGLTIGDGLTLNGNVTSSGNINVTGATSVNSDVTMQAVNITLGTVDSATATARALTLSGSGVTTVGAVGGTNKLRSLTSNNGGTTVLSSVQTTGNTVDIFDDVTLNGDVASDTGNVRFRGAVTLANGITVSGSNVSFDSTVNSDATARALTVNSAGASTFTGVVGGTNALASLTTDAAGTTNLNANVSTTGNVTLNDSVILTNDVNIAALNATLNGTVDSDATARSLTLTTGADATLNGVVGGTNALNVLATNATGTSAVNGNVTAAALSLSGNNGVTIAGNVNTTGAVNASSAAGSVTNTGTITTTNADVTLTGATAVNVNGAIAAGTGDVSLTAPVVSTTAAISGDDLNVNGSTSVTIGGNATMTGAVSLGGGSVDINAAIAGLTFNASGSTFNSNASGDLTIGNGVALTFTGDVTMNGDIVTGASGAINVVSDADIVVGAVRLGAPSITLEAGSGATNSVDVNTNSPQITGATSTSRPDSFSFIQGKEIEGQDLPSVARFGDGSDAAILNGMNYLARSKSGVITLTTGAAATKVQGTNLTLTGGLDITLGTDLTLDSLLTNGGGTVKAIGPITLTANDATTGFIRFESDLEVSNALTLRANEIDFNNTVTPNAGASLTLTSADPATSIRLNAAADSGASTLDLTAGDLSRLTSGFDSITFGSADHTGTITLAADATFSDRVIFLGTGDLELCADVTTEGEEVIFSTPVVICEDVTVDTTDGGAIATGANVTFGSTIRADDQLAGRDLVLTTGSAGVLSVAGDIGGADAGDDRLGSLTVNGNTTLAGNVTIRTTEGAGSTADVTFNGTVDGAQDLTIITLDSTSTPVGAVNFTQNVGATTTLNSLTVNAESIALRNVNTVGNQSYTALANTSVFDTDNEVALSSDGTVTFSGPLTLDSNLTVQGLSAASGAGAVFNGTVDSGAAGPFDLSVNMGDTRFGANVGATSKLRRIVTDAAGTTTIGTGGAISVSTTQDQSYGDAVGLDGAVTVSSDTPDALGVGVNFAGAVTTATSASSNASLVVNTAGNGATRFATTVGGSGAAALSSIETNADGSTLVGGDVTTTGDQFFRDAVVLNGDVVFTGDDLNFDGTVRSDGTERRLTANSAAAGATNFGGTLGGDGSAGQRLASITTNGGGTVTLGDDVFSSGDVLFGDRVVLADNITVEGANVTFSAAIVSDAVANRDLTVNSSGNGVTTFAAGVGGTTAADRLRTLRTNDDGQTRISGDVRTSGVDATESIVFADDVVLNTDSVIDTLDGAITFVKRVDSNGAGEKELLNVNSPEQTTFGGAVGSIDALKRLTTDAAGSTRIRANISAQASAIESDGNITFNDAVLIDPADATVPVVISGRDVTFSSTVNASTDGVGQLVVNTTSSGDTQFAGQVGSAAAGRLQSIETNADGRTLMQRGVFVTRTLNVGDQAVVAGTISAGVAPGFTGRSITFGNRVTLTPLVDGSTTISDGSTVIDGGAGGVLFRGDIVASANNAQDLTVLSRQAATISGLPAAPVSTIPFGFGGSVGSNDIRVRRVRIGTGTAGSPGVINDSGVRTADSSSIVFGNFDTAGNLLSTTTGSTNIFAGSQGLTLGVGERLLSTRSGGLSIRSNGPVTVGDLSSITSINIQALSIAVRLRAGGAVAGAASDVGTDWVAGTTIATDKAITTLGVGDPLLFCTNQPGQTIIGGVPTTSITRPSDSQVDATLFRPGTTAVDRFQPLDLTAVGTVGTALANSIAGAIPRDQSERAVTTTAGLSKELQDLLRNRLNIGSRVNLTMEETLLGLQGRNVYMDDASKRVNPNRLDTPQVALARVQSAPVSAAVAAYDSLGDKAAIKVMMDDLYYAYIDAAGDAGANVQGFAKWLTDRAASGDATESETKAVELLRSGVPDFHDKVDMMGLSPFEASVPRRKLFLEIAPSEISGLEQWMQLIDIMRNGGTPVSRRGVSNGEVVTVASQK